MAAAALDDRVSGNAHDDGGVAIFADYEGHRTKAMFRAGTKRVDVIEGPLSGAVFKSPPDAARAVVGPDKPEGNPNCSGWSFWTIDDGSGAGTAGDEARSVIRGSRPWPSCDVQAGC